MLGSVKGGLCSRSVHVESKLENSLHFSKASLLVCTAGSGVVLLHQECRWLELQATLGVYVSAASVLSDPL